MFPVLTEGLPLPYLLDATESSLPFALLCPSQPSATAHSYEKPAGVGAVILLNTPHAALIFFTISFCT
jgi:hypothetical protein